MPRRCPRLRSPRDLGSEPPAGVDSAFQDEQARAHKERNESRRRSREPAWLERQPTSTAIAGRAVVDRADPQQRRRLCTEGWTRSVTRGSRPEVRRAANRLAWYRLRPPGRSSCQQAPRRTGMTGASVAEFQLIIQRICRDDGGYASDPDICPAVESVPRPSESLVIEVQAVLPVPGQRVETQALRG